MSYFNTTSASGNALRLYQTQAGKQDELILNLFTSNPVKAMTAEYVYEVLFTTRTPLTSVRRSVNTLEKAGMIQRTGNLLIGSYGRPVNEYVLKSNNNQLTLI